SMTEEATEEFLSVLRPYTMLVVLDGKLGPFGGITFVEPGELRKSIVLIDAEGDRYVPLAEGAVSADATNLAVMMKPLLSNMLGPTGENMGFFFLPATTEAGGLIADPLGEGTFTVRVGDQPFEWRTPLSSAIPSKVCPVDGEEMSGAWSYCPWHGKKLGAK
ncbi:MAG: hypothetical protein GTN83_16055, partial [Acidobacteria bacterium]|nr:hypothetical protein [Acidobacteriota bacterium]